jgi:hypothetical protein
VKAEGSLSIDADRSTIEREAHQGHAFAPALDSRSLATWIEKWRQRNDMPNISPAAIA